MRLRGRLTELAVKQANKPGSYFDGNGLRLQVTVGKRTTEVSKSWVLRLTVPGGRVREMGLGSQKVVGLSAARKLAEDAHRDVLAGLDPIAARKAAKLGAIEPTAPTPTFKACAEMCIESKKPGWKNAKHATQWSNTLRDHAYSTIGAVPVDAISLDMILRVLRPIWSKKTVTAKRVQQRIETILNWATVMNLRVGENPARWRGHLDLLFAAPKKTTPVRHHPAYPYANMQRLWKALRAAPGVGALCLQFQILTTLRSGAVVAAEWREIDFNNLLWTIPGKRMKATKDREEDFIVPLSDHAAEVLHKAKLIQESKFVFPGAKMNSHVSPAAIDKQIERIERELKVDHFTGHGFRSTFRDWAAETTEHSAEVVEKALAHVVANQVEAAYRRGLLLEKRRLLMQDWANHCTGMQAPEMTLLESKTRG